MAFPFNVAGGPPVLGGVPQFSGPSPLGVETSPLPLQLLNELLGPDKPPTEDTPVNRLVATGVAAGTMLRELKQTLRPARSDAGQGSSGAIGKTLAANNNVDPAMVQAVLQSLTGGGGAPTLPIGPPAGIPSQLPIGLPRPGLPVG